MDIENQDQQGTGSFIEMLPVSHTGPAGQAEFCSLDVWMTQWYWEEGFGFVRHWGTLWDKPGLYKRNGLLHLNRDGNKLLVLKNKKVAEQLLN